MGRDLDHRGGKMPLDSLTQNTRLLVSFTHTHTHTKSRKATCECIMYLNFDVKSLFGCAH